jgi:hypothetical protein
MGSAKLTRLFFFVPQNHRLFHVTINFLPRHPKTRVEKSRSANAP